MKTEEKALVILAKRIQELRKHHGWSQPELGKKIGTSGAIVGRYERGEVTPSIEVARKMAKVFDVTVDYLISGRDIPDILKDRDMLNRWQNLEELPSEDKDHIIYVVDGLIRDAKARKTYTS